MSDQHTNIANHVSVVMDAGAAGAVVGSILGWLPPIATLGAIIWYAIMIYESKTVQGWLQKRADKRKMKSPSSQRKEHHEHHQ